MSGSADHDGLMVQGFPGIAGRGAVAALRRFLRPPPARQHCELCGLSLPPDHSHLIDLSDRRLLCACDACGLLFTGRHSGRYRAVPRRVELLQNFAITEAQWEALNVPIGLAFFFHSTPAARVVAVYPSPAGATESLLTFDAWRQMAEENPVLGELDPDVEALLVNRVGRSREYYRVPIDECYRLVGLIRSRWRGLSGGAGVGDELARFFSALKDRSAPPAEGRHNA